MKRFKKILKITGISLLTLILLALLIPVLFKKQIQRLVKREINKSLNATVDFKDAKLSLFKNFPKATITVKGLTIVGKDYFAKDTLLATDKLSITAGLFSVIKGKNIKVHGVYLQNPRIHALVNRFGKSNFDIVKSSGKTSTTTADTSASNFKLALKKYEISNGYIEYDDVPASTHLELSGLNHSGSGNLMSDVFTLHTNTKAASAFFSQDGIPYLYNYKLDMGANVDIDLRKNTYTFKTDDIQVNALKLAAKGFVKIIDAKTTEVDIVFNAPTSSFKEMYSMVPAAYTEGFENVKTTGKASFKGFVKGISAPEQLPAYHVELKVENGTVQYPGLSGQIKNINLDLHAMNKDGKPDNAVVDIPKGHLEMQNEPFDFHFIYTNPYTIQYIDAGVKGKLNLADLSKIIQLDKGTKLSGLMQADAYAKGPLQALEKASGNFQAGGFFDIQSLFYSSPQIPQPVQNGNIRATVQNSGGIADQTAIDISKGHIELGGDPLDFTLSLKQPVTNMQFAGTAKGKIILEKLKQFGIIPKGTTVNGTVNIDAGFAGSKALIDKKDYDKISLSGNASLNNIQYKSPEYPSGVTVSSASLKFNPTNITLENLNGNYLGTNFSGNGSLNHLIGYMFRNETLTGNMSIRADKVDLNKWMATNSSAAPATTNSKPATAAQPFAIPATMDITCKTTVGKLIYDSVTYSNLGGTLQLQDEKATLQNIQADALDGSILVNGSYSTKVNKAKPDISLAYNIKGMDVQKVFYAFNTSKFLMPVGKWLGGKLNSQLSMIGNMDGNMMPLLSSLTGNGNMLLLEGVLEKFAPLEKIANTLQVDRLKSIAVKEIKNYIEFANGKVLVKPFKVHIQDIDMEIGGFHGFDQSLDYKVNMQLPRSLMGAKGTTLVDGLVAKANAKGVPIKVSDMVNLNIKITGTITNPQIAIDLKEMAGNAVKELETQVKDFAKAKADSLKQKATDSLNIIKQKAEEKVEEKIKEKMADAGIDTTNLQIKNATDSLKKRAKDSAKSRLKKLIFN